MPADGLTKALLAQKHAIFVRQLNPVDISDRLACIEKEDDGDSEYQNTAAQQRQRESILSYANLLSSAMYQESDAGRTRLKGFKSVCIELIETACLKDRAKLIQELFCRAILRHY